jgi:glycosyltransferase involved in cell wall biosynthesis
VLNVAIRLGEQKGTDILLRSWAELSKHERLPDLVIVGDGPERSDLERLASRLGIGEATRFVGTLARPELVRLFQHAAFVVSASREETFGLAAVEALACGTPVVATRTGEARTFGPDLGLTVDPDDIEELGRAIAEMARTRQVYDSQHLHDEMGRRYGRDVVRRQLLALYGDLIRARS